MDSFFERPILNSPYAYPDRHWELDDDGQPTNQILPTRRDSKLLTPVPKPQKRRRTTERAGFVFDSGHGLSTQEQGYNPTPIINEVRRYVEGWRGLGATHLCVNTMGAGLRSPQDHIDALRRVKEEIQ